MGRRGGADNRAQGGGAERGGAGIGSRGFTVAAVLYPLQGTACGQALFEEKGLGHFSVIVFY